jgi:hypothetical protein
MGGGVSERRGTGWKKNAEAFLGLSGPFPAFLHPLKQNGWFLYSPALDYVADQGEYEQNFIVKICTRLCDRPCTICNEKATQ